MKSIITLLVLLFALPASAYDWSGNKWNGREPIPYLVSDSLSEDVPDPACLEAIQMGYDAWTVLTCSYFVWEYRGRTPITAWGAGDGANVASWRESAWNDSSTALGIASTIFGFDGGISDSDIKFNGEHHQWAHFMAGGGAGDGRTDIASVGTHEAGHCIGLGHSDVPGSTMWPTTGPGDINGRSLGADDIAGACEIYPSGGEVPDPGVEPPPVVGMAGFGEDCSQERCQEMLFCVSDGRESYCSRRCEESEECGDGFYCARLSGGGGSCARGEDPTGELAGFGELCGEGVSCDRGLSCVSDEGTLYCTGPCLNEMCPGDFYCAELQDGKSVCARGDGLLPGELPSGGMPCTDRGLCARGFFCLNDQLHVDEDTGDVIPYCTNACEDNQCEDGFRCTNVPPSGTACQLIPTAGDREVGEECWVNPEAPFERPSCGDGLVCVDFKIVEGEVTEKGFCTKNCTPSDCCPDGWGCVELTPVIGQCREGQGTDERFMCTGGGEGGMGGGEDAGPPSNDGGPGGDGGGDGGCAQSSAPPAGGALALLLLLAVRRRRG